MSAASIREDDRKRLEADANGFIIEAIHDFVRTNPANRLDSFDHDPIFEPPLVGFADGDDPLFDEYRKVVRADHLTPREALVRHLRETLRTDEPEPARVSVVSFVLPVNRKTLATNAREKQGPSLRWNHTRWKGQDFITELARYLVRTIEGSGFLALAPDLSPFFQLSRDPLASNWSQRHMAYAAGLGTFSLSDGFITVKGQAMRCGSVVTDLILKASPRPYAHHLANCLYYAAGKCGACIRRCPGEAISEKGHDKNKCFQVIFKEQKPWLDGAHGPGYIGQYAGCGLCQTGVPCEHRIPLRPDKGAEAL